MKRILPTSLRNLGLSVALAAGLSTPSLAGDGVIDEVRFGGTWAQPVFSDRTHAERDQAGLNIELFFAALDFNSESTDSPFLKALLTPRPTIGGMWNFADNGTSFVHAGLMWQFPMTELFFIEAGFSGSYSNAASYPTRERAGVGSKWNFRSNIGFGFNVSENVTVVTQFEHLSHRNLGSRTHNRGLNNLSVRVGYKF